MTKNKGFTLSSAKGFTLIELMVVIAVIAILATIALFGLSTARGAARNTQRQQIMNSVRAALERYYGDNNSYLAGTSFSTMITTLTNASYLGSLPTDPGCGGGNVGMAAGPFSNTSWVPCGAANASVIYTYNGANASYTLSLTKEGGGSSAFRSPL